MEFYKTPFLNSLCALDPQVVIFSEANNVVTAGELYNQSVALAAGLRDRGFQANDRLVLIVPPGKEFLEIFFASTMLKGVVAAIDPEMGRDNFESKLRQFNPRWMFIDRRLLWLRENFVIRYLYLKLYKKAFYFSFSEVAKIIATGKSLPLFAKVLPLGKIYKRTIENVSFRTEGNHEFMITYTSGTIAEPKGVVHSVDSLFMSLAKIRDLLGSTKDVRIAAYLSHFLLLGICSGNPVFLFDRDRSSKWIIRFLEQKKINTMFGPPFFYMPLINFCKAHNRLLPHSVQLIILGSAPVHPKFLQLLYDVLPAHAKVTCVYGMTENLVIAAIDGKEKINSVYPGDVVGKPVEGVKISTSADSEIVLNSPQLFSRYLHLANRETPHCTGDMGYLAVDGTLVLNGRKKDMIIRRDTNIYPAIYEKTIKNIPGIEEAVMIGVYSEVKQDEEVILVVDSEKYSENQLLTLLRSGPFSIDKEAMPDKIVFGKIPVAGRQHKPDRKSLRKKFSK